MDAIESRLVVFSVFSRFVVIFLQVIFNLCVPDHDAHVFQAPGQNDITFGDHLVSICFGGFRCWDAQYFLHIAKYGYTYENTLAFFPLFPLSVRIVAHILWPLLFYVLSYHSCLLLAGVLLNTFLFLSSTLILYKLTYSIFKSKETSYITALLFCINPASIFFSALYSETLFSTLTFFGLLCLEKRNKKLAVLALGLSTAVRSNGILNTGFLLHAEARHLVIQLSIEKNNFVNQLRIASHFIVTILIKLLLCLFPFISYQIYSTLLYCYSHLFTVSETMPAEVLAQAFSQNYKLPFMLASEWCEKKIPLSYSYVQQHYWNVGFLCYYELKQIPNFLLAAPILIIIVMSSLHYLKKNSHLIWSAGLFQTTNYQDLYMNENIFVYFVHSLVFSIFCVFFIHVQVSTRLLASSSPVLYWIVGSLLISKKKSPKKTLTFPKDKLDVFSDLCFLYGRVIQSSNRSKMCCWYFLIYFIAGIFMHVNYLPWT